MYSIQVHFGQTISSKSKTGNGQRAKVEPATKMVHGNIKEFHRDRIESLDSNAFGLKHIYRRHVTYRESVGCRSNRSKWTNSIFRFRDLPINCQFVIIIIYYVPCSCLAVETVCISFALHLFERKHSNFCFDFNIMPVIDQKYDLHFQFGRQK